MSRDFDIMLFVIAFVFLFVGGGMGFYAIYINSFTGLLVAYAVAFLSIPIAAGALVSQQIRHSRK